MRELRALEEGIGWTFGESDLLRQALTHRSASGPNNERLEFLGDAVLNFVIADEIYRRRPDLREGELSRLRAALVNKNALAAIARDTGLGGHIVLGSGELKSGGRRRDSILADALEALIGAVYLDGGFEAGRDLVLRLYTDHLDRLPEMEAHKDAKTRLQEYLQARGLELPAYAVEEVSGRAHEQVFHVVCTSEALQQAGEGRAGSRRQAEQEAAADLLRRLGSHNHDPGEPS
ncbi:ribonuclease III [Spiribacter sp. 2438]|uniref:ribonuclease III n=1 Tax=Spiribacter sp. 2438 TaxID=2666185 RepID=UPI0012AFCBE1|nr:ribonuclease III [Spiribacter sp. 2438]QGM21916.1 ribonuclease III [Spiribacter sp. 2438]